MNASPQFDEYAERYSAEVDKAIGFAGQEHAFYIQAKVDSLLAIARRRLGSVATARVLDVGCGTGEAHAALLPHVGSLEGADISPVSLEIAAERSASVRYHLYDGRRLPFSDGSFDMVFAACVLHHVEPEARQAFVAEMRRVTRRGGLVALAEHNPVNPLTRLVVARCAFDDGVVLVRHRAAVAYLRGAGVTPTDAPYILFFPWSSRAARLVEQLLRRLPLGAQYVTAGQVT